MHVTVPLHSLEQSQACCCYGFFLDHSVRVAIVGNGEQRLHILHQHCSWLHKLVTSALLYNEATFSTDLYASTVLHTCAIPPLCSCAETWLIRSWQLQNPALSGTKAYHDSKAAKLVMRCSGASGLLRLQRQAESALNILALADLPDKLQSRLHA